MTITCNAIYEQGVLRPAQPLDLQEGAEVEIVVMPKQAQEPLSGKALYEAVMKGAALPMEGKDDGFSGRDHDEVLYPKKGKMP